MQRDYMTAIALAQIAQTARHNAAACCDLADRLFKAGETERAERLLDIARDCQHIVGRCSDISNPSE